MAKCNHCGKSGLFFRVNTQGICNECERITKLQDEENQLKERIRKTQDEERQFQERLLQERMKNIHEEEKQSQERIKKLQTEEGQFQERLNKTQANYELCEKSYLEMENNKNQLYNEISERAKKEALSEISNQIENKTIELQDVIKQVQEQQKLLENAKEEYNEGQKSLQSNANKLRRIQTIFKSMQYSTKRYFDDETFSKEILADNLPTEAEELLSATVTLKLHLMDIRELHKLYNQNDKIIRNLLIKYQGRYTTKANMTIYKLMVIALESELQNVLFNLSYSKLDKSIKDIKTITAKYQKIAIEGNQSIVSTVKKFIGEIEYLFIEAIKIEYEYYIQKERIREEQKAIREQMRQEAAERKILEEERKKVEQEEEKYKNEIINVKDQLSETKDELKIKQLEERIAKIQAQLGEVEKKKEEITKLQNGQAGYIYIISNLGSFGENVFKVGMTRRSDPQERVTELGDASVPFKFDVHSFIFSNNAPELEYKLHKQLNNKRINKVNLRREFFNTTIDELEDLVYSLEPSAEFNRTMLAEQYYQSMTVNEVPESVSIIDDENIGSDEE